MRVCRALDVVSLACDMFKDNGVVKWLCYVVCNWFCQRCLHNCGKDLKSHVGRFKDFKV